MSEASVLTDCTVLTLGSVIKHCIGKKKQGKSQWVKLAVSRKARIENNKNDILDLKIRTSGGTWNPGLIKF